MRSQADREGLGKRRTGTRQRRACFSTQEILNMARNAEYAARGSMAGSLRFVFFLHVIKPHSRVESVAYRLVHIDHLSATQSLIKKINVA